jgi:hypothetical protein
MARNLCSGFIGGEKKGHGPEHSMSPAFYAILFSEIIVHTDSTKR